MESPPQSDPTEEGRVRFSTLMRAHHRELLVFAGAATRNREAAQDIVQDAFVSAWRKFDEFDESRDFGAWMRGIVRNKTKDWFRAQVRQPSRPGLDESDLGALESEIASWQTSRESGTAIYEIVEGCIARLPANFRDAVRQFYFEKESGDEAASALAISPANLRKRLERARALLHECIAGKTAPLTQIQTEQSHV